MLAYLICAVFLFLFMCLWFKRPSCLIIMLSYITEILKQKKERREHALNKNIKKYIHPQTITKLLEAAECNI